MQRKKLHYRRQGSLEEEREDGLRRNSPLLTFNHGTLPAIKQPVRGINGAADAQPVMRITVDLWKLQQDVRQVLPEAQVGYDPRKPGQAPAPVHGTDSLHKERRIKVPGLQAPELDQQTDTEFSLFGRKAAVYQSDPSKDLLTGNEKSAEDIRRSVRQIHSMIQTNRERANVRKRQQKTTWSEEGRHFINLLPLCTVDRAYENRERYNSQMKKRSLVLQVHADRQQGRYKIEEFWEDRKNLAWYRNDIDAQTLARHSESDLLDKSNSMDKVKHRHRYFCQQKEARQVDIARVKAFNTQHASVTKTLLRHDRMSRNRKEMQEKIANVQSMKENRERQKELIRCLQKQRQLDLQSENASEKVTLSSLVLLKANDRLQEAQTHVTAAKGQSVTAKPMYKVPVEQPVSKETRLKQEGT